ncbi:Hypothetical protein ORPV_1150 [Orpheovirus IHUMI-LCC2]|uniref:Uncharacterized protein n=1 Tax=Orpheovirus IHUMI-LCC2 TaxID=2023057 RepID=A0A2I2L694_9VIRU|nr:Hypothetical protein ORPV_1150 [Orpheovirus IHUMI-LCC2]SNW63054.1 Hypothetical protein ORPV_1150 [Orpheovirus IHUMI-LCC2]
MEVVRVIPDSGNDYFYTTLSNILTNFGYFRKLYELNDKGIIPNTLTIVKSDYTYIKYLLSENVKGLDYMIFTTIYQYYVIMRKYDYVGYRNILDKIIEKVYNAVDTSDYSETSTLKFSNNILAPMPSIPINKDKICKLMLYICKRLKDKQLDCEDEDIINIIISDIGLVTIQVLLGGHFDDNLLYRKMADIIEDITGMEVYLDFGNVINSITVETSSDINFHRFVKTLYKMYNVCINNNLNIHKIEVMRSRLKYMYKS